MNAWIGTRGRSADRSAAVRPVVVKQVIATASESPSTIDAAAWATAAASPVCRHGGCAARYSAPWDSTARAIRVAAEAASNGNSPIAVSPESMIASAPSRTAVATSLASARVGRGDRIIDSSICVATITGRPATLAARSSRFCTRGISSIGSSTPRSPRATIAASATSRIRSKSSTAGRVSIFATIGTGRSPIAARSSSMSEGSRTKDWATRSTPRSRTCRSISRSRSVTGGRLSRSAGTFTPWWLPTEPARTHSVCTRSPSIPTTVSSTAPSARSTRSPTRRSFASPA